MHTVFPQSARSLSKRLPIVAIKYVIKILPAFFGARVKGKLDFPPLLLAVECLLSMMINEVY